MYVYSVAMRMLIDVDCVTLREPLAPSDIVLMTSLGYAIAGDVGYVRHMGYSGIALLTL